jgi:hypothetical protein
VTTTDGGTLAAVGFRRQYLAAAEEILIAMRAHGEDTREFTLVIEPTRADLGTASVADDNIVDFAVEIDGAVARRLQVKSSKVPSHMNPLKYADAKSIFNRLGTGSGEAVILTNKPLQKKLLRACGPPTRSPLGQDVYPAVAQAITSGLTDPVRLVCYDGRSAADIKQSIFTLIGELRQDRALGLGERSIGLLAAMMIDSIFESAADLLPRRLPAEEVKALLCLRDTQIAHALRQFDWGVPLAEVPRLVSAVARTDQLALITQLFSESVQTRNPKILVITGVTGFGKSTIAADFCHLNRHFYEEVCWIDSRSSDLLQARIKDIVTSMGVDVTSVSDLGLAFRTEMSRRGGPFVLAFDGARCREDIEQFVPTSGCGFVVVTTNNSTSWWHTATQLHIGSFGEDEAIACFEAYAQLESGEFSDVVRDVVNRLERVPLAIAMAALYFRNADEDIQQLSEKYFNSLDDFLDDSSAKPEGFDRTAFAAIRLAVSRLGTTEGAGSAYKRETQLLVYHSAFFAPELIPLNLLLQTVDSNMITIDLTKPPVPAVASQQRRNAILTNLRTQTIAQRRNYFDASGSSNPASDTISIHPLVHEILRTIHQQAAPSEGDLLNLLGGFMACLYGWIIDFRRTASFFPIEQLLTHGEWILNIVDDFTLPEDADPHDLYVFRCAKIYLRAEIANCYATRGEYQRGVDMLQHVLDESASITLTVAPQGMVAKVACDAIADAMLGDLGTDVAVRMARNALAALTKLEQFEDQPKRGDVIYPLAAQAAQAIHSFDSAEAHEIANQFAAVANRQQLSKVPEAAIIKAIENSLKTGQFTRALQIVESARGGDNPAAHTSIMFDNFAVIANLHLRRFAAAADGIDRILYTAEGNPFLTAHLQAATTEIGNTLTATRTSWTGSSPRLASQQARLQDLSNQLAR